MEINYKKTFVGAIILILLVFSAFFIKVNNVNEKVYLNEVLVSTLNKTELDEVVTQYIEALEKKIVTIGDVKLLMGDLGISFDRKATKKKLLKELRTSLFERLEAKAVEGDGREIIRPVMVYNEDELRLKLNYIVQNFDQSPVEAKVYWDNELGWQLQEGQFGKKIEDMDFVARQIAYSLVSEASSLRRTKNYKIKYEVVEPEVTVFEAKIVYKLLHQKYLNKPILVVADGHEISTIDMSTSGDWFEFDYENSKVLVNLKKLDEVVDEVIQKYETQKQGVVVKDIQEFESEYDDQTYFKAVIEGDMAKQKMVDRVSLKKDILNYNGTDPIELKFHDRSVSIQSEVEGMEFPDLLAYGKSDYSKGAYANRVHNIKTAAALQDMVVIPQGGSYSFNRVGGWVTYAKGYKNGEVIFGKEAKYVAGGGVCQVSTTMYRAAVYAGLEIENRKNHSWDVSYYRDIHGVDAAIYPPGGLDLSFRNDTPGPILVHTYVDEENKNVYFEMYGTSDGRSVSLGEPEITWLGGKAKKIITAWEIVRANGVTEEREIVSRYSR